MLLSEAEDPFSQLVQGNWTNCQTLCVKLYCANVHYSKVQSIDSKIPELQNISYKDKKFSE